MGSVVSDITDAVGLTNVGEQEEQDKAAQEKARKQAERAKADAIAARRDWAQRIAPAAE